MRHFGSPSSSQRRLHPRVERLTRRTLRLAALAAVAPTLIAVHAARAEEAQAAGETLPPQRIESILAGQGYVGVSDLRRRGSVWVADVVERNGRRYRAVVDGASGEVSGLRQVPSSRQPHATPVSDPAER